MDRRLPPLLLAAALVVGLVGQWLLVRAASGINVGIVTAAAVAALVLVRRAGSRVDPLDRWIAPGAIVLAGFAAIRADPALLTFDLLLAAALVAASAAALSGIAVVRRSTAGVLALAVYLGEFVLVGLAQIAALSRPFLGHVRLRPAGPAREIARGLLIALPVVLVFVVLFAAADAVFARIVDDALSLEVDLGTVPQRFAIVVAIAWPLAGLLGVAAWGIPALEARSLGAAARTSGLTDTTGRPMLRIGLVEALVVLVAVDLLFAAFVALQVAYLFGGRDTLAAAGMTYSTYARRGFFELVAVAVLAGALVAALRAALPRSARSFVGASVALLALTAVVLASAGIRLGLYQAAYGWTELRFYVAVGILWLAVGIVICVGLLLRDRMDRLLHALGMLAVVTTLAVNVVGPLGFVADRNVERLADPSLIAEGGHSGFDAEYLISLGDEAVPALVRAVPLLPPGQALRVRGELLARKAALAEDETLTDWRAWNLVRERAKEALAGLGG